MKKRKRKPKARAREPTVTTSGRTPSGKKLQGLPVESFLDDQGNHILLDTSTTPNRRRLTK